MIIYGKGEIKMLEKLMNNPYAWGILALLTIISFVYAVVIQQKSKEKKIFSYIKKTNELIAAKKSTYDNLYISYCGQQIESFCVSKFVVWNSGNRILNSSDMVDSKELTFKVNEENKILDAEIIGVSEVTNNFYIKKKEEKEIKINFDYVEKKDGFVIQIMHTGSEKDICVECKIKGGLPIKNEDDKSVPRKIVNIFSSKVFIKISIVLILLYGLLFLFGAVFFSVAIFNGSLRAMISIYSNKGEVALCAIILWFFLLTMIGICYPAIKRLLNLGIPKSLKYK